MADIFDHPGGKKKSNVWEYFGFRKIKPELPASRRNLDLTEAICRVCRKVYKNTGNTTNFQNHIRGEHAKSATIPAQTVPSTSGLKKQSILTDFNNNQPQASLGPERKKRIDQALLRLLVGKTLPPSLVDNKFFKEFVAALEPRYKIPSRHNVMESLNSKKNEIEKKIRIEIRLVPGVGITHDGWTSNATQSYDTTTLHYINNSWQLCSAVLNTARIEGSHTSEKIASTLLETKQKWELPEALVATTDNAANEKKAFQLLNWLRFGCYGHRINLVLKSAMGIPEMSDIISKSRKLVTLFHTSTSVNDMLMVKQKALLPDEMQGHKLKADVPTRWNSSLDMLERVIEQIPAIMAVATDDRVSSKARATIEKSILSFEETKLAKSVVSILKPFKKGTEIVCSESNPTINKILPMVTKLFRGLEEKDDDNPVVKELKKKMREQLGKRTDTEDIVLLGCILNPFTKGFEHNPDLKSNAEHILYSKATQLTSILQLKKEKDEVNEPSIPSDTTGNAPVLPVAPLGLDIQQNETQVKNTEPKEEEPVMKKLKSADTDDWLSDVMCVGESRIDTTNLVIDEIRRYLCVVLNEDDNNLTVLDWWKKNELFFPRLANLAKQILCVQGSSVPSERVFSLAGELVSKKRSRMSPENVDMFIFLNKNMNRFW